MSELVNFVCWSSAEVTATIPTEAATPSDAVLLATHTPLRIRREGDVGQDAIVSESDVLDEFLNGDPNHGVRVATVLGESGAGKSHLIRWVNAKIESRPDRHVIYLPKTETSLKDVIEALLVNQHDPVLDELRNRVSTLGSGLSLDEMEHRILDALAEALRTAEADSAYGKALVGENGLRLFFIDPLFQQHLLRPGSFIKRRAEHALYGRDVDEPDVPLEFTVDELPLDIVDHASVEDAAAVTQRLFRRLVASTAMQGEAVRLMNEYLDVAVTKAANLNVGDLGQAFRKIRERLIGQEVILLVEDVALIQGVRRDLLDAIVEVGVVQGEQKYATVRTLLAVTPSYYYEQLPETFRGRARESSPLYWVDVDLEIEGSSTDQEEVLVDFVGRYLNAARVGKAALESSAPDVPNACQACELRASCHAVFGTSGAGASEYGLYPYNRPALLRAVRACATQDGDRLLFNPRKVLSRAVKDTLNSSAQTIGEGAFPPPEFLAEETKNMKLPVLPTHIREQIEDSYSDDAAGRLQTLLTFWGNVGTEPVSDEVLRAFSHPPVRIDVAAMPEEPPSGGSAARGEEASGELPRSLQKQLEQIDSWSQGQVLPQTLARQLRRIVREALVARLDWFDPLVKEPDASTLGKAIPVNARGVSIEGANENLAIGLEPLVRVDRTARNAVTFKGLVLIDAGFPERAGEALPRLEALVMPSVGEAKKRIVDELAIDDDSLVHAAVSLIRGAAACGALPAKPKEIDYVNACLWRETKDREDAAVRSPAWLSAHHDYVSERGVVVDRFVSGIGASQGDRGGVYAIDFPRVASIIRKARVLADSEDDVPVPSWCSGAQRKLKALLRTNNQQLAHWRALLERIREYVPDDVTFTETVDAIAAAVKNGQDQGLVRVNDLKALEAANEEARRWDAAGIKEVEDLLTRAESQTGTEKLTTVGTSAGNDLPLIASYLASSSQWIEAGIRAAEVDGGSLADIDEQLNDTINTWLKMLKESNQ